MNIYFRFSLLLLLSLAACEGQKRAGQVTILHTNDMHAQFTPKPATWIDADPLPLIGGMTALEYAVRQARAKYPQSLLLDAGDISTGTLLSKIKYKGALNGGFVEMMNLLDYDAFTIGNHEFDEGQENLAQLLTLANFDVLSANLFLNGELFAPYSYKIYKIGSIRVGLIGLILTDLFSVTAINNLNNVEIADPAKTAQAIIDDIDPKTDLIVLLTHQGVDEDVTLASKIKNADIIIGGHSHTRLDNARKEKSLFIVQAGSKTNYLGRLTVQVAGDTVVCFDNELIPTWVDSVTSPNPEIVTLVDKFHTEINAEYGQQIGLLKTTWKTSNDYETNLGNFITDAMRAFTGTDFAMLNSGGIRTTLAAGPITKMDVMEILPFSNKITTFSCSGAVLFDMLQKDIAGSLANGYGLFQLSGIDYAYKVDADVAAKILSMQVGGKPLDRSKIYTGTTVDFVMNNLQNRFELANIQNTSTVITDLVIDYIQKNPVIESKVEGRIRQVR